MHKPSAETTEPTNVTGLPTMCYVLYITTAPLPPMQLRGHHNNFGASAPPPTQELHRGSTREVAAAALPPPCSREARA